MLLALVLTPVTLLVLLGLYAAERHATLHLE
jgi:cytochrome c oxidase subunit IV